MTVSKSIKTCFSKYAVFQRRSSRSEYWYYQLFVFVLTSSAVVLDNAFHTSFDGDVWGYGYLYALALVGTILPSISVLVRRLHDTDHSGWWFWIVLIPLVGAIVLIVWLCTKGTTGNNRFGPDPLADISVPIKPPAPMPEAQAVSAPATPSTAQASTADIMEKISKLEKLRADGVLTDEEFQDLKSKMINP
jgi:uncharacterized membrane protein YhaH (DUF805 family)